MHILIRLALLAALALSPHQVLAACGGTLTAQNNLAGLCDKATSRANLGANDAANLTTGTLPAARLPNPSASTLGGVQSVVAVTSRWINAISTSGVPALSQPAFSDLSGSAAIGQIPTGTSASTVVIGNDSRFTTNAATGVTVPFNTIPTTADLDIYGLPFAASIAAATVPTALCRVSPAATVTFLIKKWTAGNPATSSTLCTGSLSTSCAVSSCSISSTSFSSGDGISVEATAAGADSAARLSLTVPMVK